MKINKGIEEQRQHCKVGTSKDAVLKINRAPKIDIGKNTFPSVKTYCECCII